MRSRVGNSVCGGTQNEDRDSARSNKKSFLVGEHMNRLGSWLVLTLCIVTLLAVPMAAQKTSGTIRGVVTGQSVSVFANVPVEITNAETGLTRTVTTNPQGEYVAPEINVGTYTVTVKAPNFKEAVSKNVDLHTSSTQTLNIQLQVGSTSEQVDRKSTRLN